MALSLELLNRMNVQTYYYLKDFELDEIVNQYSHCEGDILYGIINHNDSFYESMAASRNLKEPYFCGIFLQDECAIWKEKFEESMMVHELSCAHIFHFKCSYFWFEKNSSCPICRIEVAVFKSINLEREVNVILEGFNFKYLSYVLTTATYVSTP
ncbi:hypothetical protein HELRODRAFT_172641 [Helobdella robusta]|uniref:RING-type domain-containing protein n=1 Tax=Helobdella robusta TaxID=6412 RepID=T1F5P6_HELRO|nr:hypothetical protein HELRODRAFT_172641 [Helobdella robusta]ESO04284.1 hypothetical protein HELRODRAFT_172641 [Helobdella robusta]